MTHHQYQPHPILEDHVQCLWTAERTFAPPNDTLDILPDSYVELVFSSGGPCQLGDEQATRDLPPYFLLGLLDRPVQMRASGRVVTVAARLYAWGFAALFGGTGHMRAMSDTGWRQLADQIVQLAQHDAAAASARLHDALIERALRADFGGPTIERITRQLAERDGRIDIRALADACHLSRRQAERRFSAVAGTSPKQLTRRMRFQQARDALWHTPDAGLAALASRIGYADQAHLSRDFKAFSGRTPRQFAAELRAAREQLRAQGVVFLQDF